VVSVSEFAGKLIGAVAGYAGGSVDTVVGRLMGGLLAFPGIVRAVGLVAVLGPSLTNVVLALVVFGGGG
jgi:ABC-type dipeptide/oligopeptide/nickel transport system permease subunit